jgi:hypothetical protein
VSTKLDHDRRVALTEAARFDRPFRIEEVWDACGRGFSPSYATITRLLRELRISGDLRLVGQHERVKPYLYEWVEP